MTGAKNIQTLLLSLLISGVLSGQNLQATKRLVDKLASHRFEGRGYVKNGDVRAANYLSKEMKKAGLIPYFDSYKQPYHFNINTFPGNCKLFAGENELVPGRDFVIHPGMRAVEKSFTLRWLPDTLTSASQVYQLIDTTTLHEGNQIVVLPAGIKNAWRHGIAGVPALLQTEKGRIWWHTSTTQLADGAVRIKVKEDKLSAATKTIRLELDAEFKQDHQSYNLAGFVRGSRQPDSLIVFVAHYDHLGMMGKKTMFPGASDNASGTALVLDLAHYYAINPSKAEYTMAFVLVSGEEAGLLGSKYFASNPPFDLSKTAFVVNFDMVGSGSEGITVVNALQFPEAFASIRSLNEAGKFVSKVVERGESCNSDHCPFYEKGVPAFFIHTQGPENQHYHDTEDKAANLPLTKYEALFELMTLFVEKIPGLPK